MEMNFSALLVINRANPLTPKFIRETRFSFTKLSWRGVRDNRTLQYENTSNMVPIWPGNPFFHPLQDMLISQTSSTFKLSIYLYLYATARINQEFMKCDNKEIITNYKSKGIEYKARRQMNNANFTL